MKRMLLAIGMVIVFFASCEPSREEIVGRLLRTEVCNGLVNPKSYDPIDVKIDSAFTPLDDTCFYSRIQSLFGHVEEVVEMKATLDSLETTHSMLKGYLGLLNPNDVWGLEDVAEYRKLKSKIDDNLNSRREEYEETLALTKQELDSLKKTLEHQKEFIGYRALHRYRFQNPEGQMKLDTVHFFINEELTEVRCSILDREWKQMQGLYHHFLDTFKK